MKYTVTWTDEASDQLCELFMAVPNRSELSRVVNAIERHLAWIIHGLLIQDAACRDVTRSVSEGEL